MNIMEHSNGVFLGGNFVLHSDVCVMCDSIAREMKSIILLLGDHGLTS